MFGKILHLGIVVPDLEKALEIYENELGISPWKLEDAGLILECGPEDM